MTDNGTRQLAQAQSQLIEQCELAREAGRASAEIAHMEAMLSAISVLLEARQHGQTFH